MADKLGAAPPKPKPKAGAGRKLDGTPMNNAQAAEEAEEAQYLSFLGQIQKQRAKVAAAKVIFDGEKTTLNSIFGVAKGQGHQRQEFEEDIADLEAMDNPGSRRDVLKRETRRFKRRGWVGLPTGQVQGALDLEGNPARDEIEWEAQGYSDSLRGLALVTPRECPPGGCANAYATGWHSGESKKSWANANVSLPGSVAPAPAAPKPAAEPTAPPPDAGNVVPMVKPEGDGFDMTDEERAAQAPRPRAEIEEEQV